MLIGCTTILFYKEHKIFAAELYEYLQWFAFCILNIRNSKKEPFYFLIGEHTTQYPVTAIHLQKVVIG